MGAVLFLMAVIVGIIALPFIVGLILAKGDWRMVKYCMIDHPAMMRKLENGTTGSMVADLGLFEANTGGASRPVSGQSVFNKYTHNPNSQYSDMKGATSGASALDNINEELDFLRMQADWLDIDDTSLEYLRDLTAYEPSKWKDKLAKKEVFAEEMKDGFMKDVARMYRWIDTGYAAMDKPA